MKSKTIRQDGFTLLEMAIVLVIVGLLIGGITLGKSLKHSADISATIADIGTYQDALVNFKSTYHALPGDMTNATTLWGIAGGTGNDNTCFNTITTGTPTCNGDGDGKVGISSTEITHFWQHLANAGLVNGHFTGAQTFVRPYGPELALTPGWPIMLQYEPTINPADSSTYYYPAKYGNIFYTNGVLSPQDALNIDQKMDDGVPGKGKTLAYKPQGSPACTTSTDPTVSTYNISGTTTAVCVLMFLTGL